jgi:hypothetical protein
MMLSLSENRLVGFLAGDKTTKDPILLLWVERRLLWFDEENVCYKYYCAAFWLRG